MSLAPLLQASPAIQIHAFAALGAFVLGSAQLIGAKGTTNHRLVGYVWVALMAVVAASSFWIHEIRQLGGYSLIHVLSVITLVSLPIAVLHARRHNVGSHKRVMLSLFLGALLIAGLFTMLPGRIMGRVVFGG
ncbi:MAG: DUF2306 domain-containing protein [Hyphomicrobiales bacterium]|nr:MAG: DUF2306 domain-containing protein [Hyphomicrobiales bacterium]